jgi:uncharacterized protein
VAAIEASPARSWWRTAWVAPWWPTQPIARPGLPVAAALLVAPADVEREHGTPACLRSFAMPCAPLPFRSIVVASTDDPYMTLTRARAFADDWGVEFVDAGALGHINVDAGFGPWPEGERMLRKLLTTGDPRLPGNPAAHRRARFAGDRGPRANGGTQPPLLTVEQQSDVIHQARAVATVQR